MKTGRGRERRKRMYKTAVEIVWSLVEERTFNANVKEWLESGGS